MKSEKEIRDTITGLEATIPHHPHAERNRMFIAALKWVLDEGEKI